MEWIRKVCGGSAEVMMWIHKKTAGGAIDQICTDSLKCFGCLIG